MLTPVCLSAVFLCPSGHGAPSVAGVEGAATVSTTGPWSCPAQRPAPRALACCQPCADSQVLRSRLQGGSSSLSWTQNLRRHRGPLYPGPGIWAGGPHCWSLLMTQPFRQGQWVRHQHPGLEPLGQSGEGAACSAVSRVGLLCALGPSSERPGPSVPVSPEIPESSDGMPGEPSAGLRV